MLYLAVGLVVGFVCGYFTKRVWSWLLAEEVVFAEDINVAKIDGEKVWNSLMTAGEDVETTVKKAEQDVVAVENAVRKV